MACCSLIAERCEDSFHFAKELAAESIDGKEGRRVIEVTEKMTIGNLVARREPFIVPPHQRAYAWESEEISDFITDLNNLYNDRLRDPSHSPLHFFGGIVSVHLNIASTSTGRQYLVVDGQQRLATFFIAISAVHAAFVAIAAQAVSEKDHSTEEEATACAKYTENTYLKYAEVDQGRLVAKLRLKLSTADHVFFEQVLNNSSPLASRESHKLLRASRDAIRDKLINPILDDSSRTVTEKLERLKQLSWCLTDGCYVIHIVSDDRNEAYQLFKVLNDRGRNLTDGDLLRSYTMELLQDQSELQSHIERHWDQILSGKPEKTDQFLRAYYASQLGDRAPSRDLFDKFSQGFFGYDRPLSHPQALQVEEKIGLIRQAYNTFLRLIEGEWPYEESSVSAWQRDRLARVLNVLGHTLCIPLLLSAHACLTEEKFNSIIDTLERCSFRYLTIVGAHPSSLAKIYYTHAKAIRADPSQYDVATLRNDLRNLISRNATDELFKANLMAKLNYSTASSQKRIIKHFLTTIEDHYDWLRAGGRGMKKPNMMTVFDLNQVTIEHIHPQNPSLPQPALEPLKHDIGNLSFWAPGENSSAGNEPFGTKRTKYASSGVKLNQALATLPDWSDVTLRERRDELVEKAVKVFSI